MASGTAAGVRFAHPVEQELARLYDRYGVAWRYEPHTVVPGTQAEGRTREAVTPDDPDVECTGGAPAAGAPRAARYPPLLSAQA